MNSCDQIYISNDHNSTNGLIAEFPVPIIQDDYYNQFIQSLRDAGFTVYLFPYDWRLDLNETAAKLDNYINSIGDPKVTLIGHSMGGLLARAYTLDPLRAQKVDKVISVGTPYWGAPKIARNIRSGETIFYNNIQLNDIWKVLRNSPGSMQILPSEAWFDQSSSYYWNSNQELLTYDDTRAFFEKGGLNGKTQNGNLIDEATNFHSGDLYSPDFDDFSNNLYVPYYVLYASHLPTYGSVREFRCWQGTCWDWYRYLPGDGTSPSRSAKLSGKVGDWSGTAITCEYVSPNIQKDHGKMMSDTSVIADILRILQGWDPYWCHTSSSIQKESALQEISPFLLLSVWGDTDVIVSDPLSRTTGVSSEGWVHNDIPLTTIDSGQGGTFVTLPISTTYTVLFTQKSVDPIQLKVTDYRSSVDGEEFNPYEQAVFMEIPSVISGTATVDLDYSAGLSSIQVQVDLNNDTIPDQIITPTVILNQQGIQDITPPRTSIIVEGAMDSLGFYNGIITVTLTANDLPEVNATGVYLTEYSVDGGETWLEYSDKIQIVAENVPLFLARSIDKGNNLEYPFAEKRLRPYNLYLPAIY